MTAIIGALWIAGTYIHDQKVQADKEATIRRIDARKPFLARKLEMYDKTAEVTGQLVTLHPDSSEWAPQERKFWELYYTELTMVEDRTVEHAMKDLADALKEYVRGYKYKNAGTLPPGMTQEAFDLLIRRSAANFELATLGLAQALRSSLEEDWNSKVQ